MSPENAPHHGSRSSFIEQEFVIGGYTEPEGARKHFGALLIGVYEEKKLKFAGRVGTGFNDKLLRSLSADFDKIRVENCTFFNVPAKGRSQWDLGLTAAGRASSPVARSINSGAASRSALQQSCHQGPFDNRRDLEPIDSQEPDPHAAFAKIAFEVYICRISFEHYSSDLLFPQTPLVLSVTRFRVSLELTADIKPAIFRKLWLCADPVRTELRKSKSKRTYDNWWWKADYIETCKLHPRMFVQSNDDAHGRNLPSEWVNSVRANVNNSLKHQRTIARCHFIWTFTEL